MKPKNWHNQLALMLILAIMFAALSVGPAPAQAQGNLETSGPSDPAELEAFIDGLLAAQMESQHVAGVTVSVVKDGDLFFAKGYGYADVANQVPVDPETTLFRVGSVSKLFTWTAVMQLVEQGLLDLDADVNTYIDFTIPDTYPEAITLAHLLAHTPGFEDRSMGMAAVTPEEMITNGEWLAENIPARVRPPGQFSSYSNYGAALAGYIVERVSDMSFEEYVEKNILEPLGMMHTSARQPLPAGLAANMSQGYRYANGAYEVQDFELIIIGPAGGLSATATDIARFMIAHLHAGRYGEAQILEEATARLMHSQLFTHDPRLNGFAHGFYESNQNGQWIIGHGGDTAWFHSELALFPEHDLGLFVSYNSEAGSELPQALLEAFVDRYFPQPETALTPPADFAERAGRFTGSYRVNRMSYTTPEKIAALFMPITVSIAEDDTLVVSTPVGVKRFVEIEPLLFSEVGGDDTLLFREDTQGQITHAFLNSLPIFALEKLTWYEAGPFHFTLLAVCMLLFLSVLFAAPVGFLVNRGRPDRPARPILARAARWALGIFVLLVFLFIIVLIAALSDTTALLTGDVPLLGVLPFISGVMVLLAVGVLVFTVLAWKNRYWGLSGRIHYTLTMLGALAFIWFLYFWNMLFPGL